MRLPAFEYYAPPDLAQALKIKAELGSAAAVLAGGTDLLVNLKHRLSNPAALISLKNVESLRGVSVKSDALVLGASTSLDDVEKHTAIRSHFPLLVHAVQSIGAVGIQRFRGTIGGNLCLTPRCLFYNQSLFWRTGKGQCHRTGGKDCLALKGSESCQAICSGDTVPVLAALSAQLTLAGAGGTRSLPVMEFFTGKGESPFHILPDEILTEIRLPLPWAPISGSYRRLSWRSAVDFPMVNAAAVAIIEKGKVESFRLVVSALGPAPVVLKDAEAALKGKQPAGELMAGIRDMAIRTAEGSAVDNASATKEYRAKMCGVMAERAAREALGL